MSCPWCPPAGQCWSCERAEFWDQMWERLRPGAMATVDRYLDEVTSPERIKRLGRLFGADRADEPPSGRTRIEIVADDLGRPVRVDYEADMAYFEVRTLRPGEYVHRSDVKREDNSLIVDYDEDDELLGVEVFLVGAAVRLETIIELERLLAT